MYDFSNFIMIFDDILRYESPTSTQLNAMKNELNKGYKGNGKCTQIFFTKNTDRAFFGMCVYPNISDNYTTSIFQSSDKYNCRMNFDYMIEFDSKLFDPLLALTSREIVAILLHEIGHIVMDEAKNADIISDFVNDYIASKDKTINMKDVSNCREFFKYIYIFTIQKMNSIFNKYQEEFEADRFSVDMGFGPDLESAFVKILKAKGITQQSNSKFSTLLWGLTVYKQLYKRKKFITRTMDTLNGYSGSKLERDANNNLKKAMVNDYNRYITESVMENERLEYINEMFNKIKTSALKGIEDDAYVYAVRIKNIDNQIEAVDLLRDINGKINIVEDYLQLTKNLSENDIRRWNLLLEKLRGLRESLIKSDNYKPKYYGLYVQMPVTNKYY